MEDHSRFLQALFSGCEGLWGIDFNFSKVTTKDSKATPLILFLPWGHVYWWFPEFNLCPEAKFGPREAKRDIVVSTETATPASFIFPLNCAWKQLKYSGMRNGCLLSSHLFNKW